MNKLFAIVVVLLLLPWFFIGGPDYYSSRLYKSLWNTGHIVFFLVAAYLLLSVTVRPVVARFSQGFLLAVFVSLVFGVLIEVAQYGVAREPDVYDLLRDVLGALIGFLVFFWRTRQQRPLFFSTLFLIATIGIALQLIEMGRLAWDQRRMHQDFPVLADFESIVEGSRWSGDAQFYQSVEHVAHGAYSLKVEVSTKQYSGVDLRYLAADWRGYDQLLMAIYNAEPEKFPIVLRIHDKAHRQSEQLLGDRFNRRFELLPGWNHLVIELNDVVSAPERRVMDLASIEGLSLFVINADRAKTFYLDHLRLR